MKSRSNPTFGWKIPGIRAIAVTVVLWVLTVPRVGDAGPPFATDDPEPVGYRQWEVYLASQVAQSRDAWSGTAPHLEVNYGPTSDSQLHLIVPLAWTAPDHARVESGVGDIEVGLKLRLIHETRGMPQVGTFVLVDLPTGDAPRGLGAGHTQVFLPVWLQKSFGPWTTYGGGGLWIAPGADDLSHWFYGWQVQRRFGSWITLGVELFGSTPVFSHERTELGANAGAIVNLSPLHHVLVSAGERYRDAPVFQAYLAYQLTFGPAPGNPADTNGGTGLAVFPHTEGESPSGQGRH